MTFCKNHVFPPFLSAILNFCVKRKNVFISEMERDRAISTKVLKHRESAESTGDFSALSIKFHFFSETERERAISMKFLTHRVAAESTGDFLTK